MSPEIEVRVVRTGSNSVVYLDGNINGKTSHEVRAAILELLEKGCEERVIVDLTAAEQIDGMGASILVEGLEVAEKRKVDFILTGLN